MEQLEARKRGCDELFKQGDVGGARAAYEALLSELGTFQSSVEPSQETPSDLQALRKNLLNNVSVVCLKLEDYAAVISHCSEGIALDAANLKALYRRSQAYKATGTSTEDEAFFALAQTDIDAILAIETQNAQAKALKVETRKALDDLQTRKRYAYAYAYAKGSTETAASERQKEKEEADSAARAAIEEATSLSGGAYSFMNPSWAPPPQQQQQQLSSSLPTSIFAANAVTAAAETTRAAAAAPQAASMRQLVKDARRSAAASGTGTGTGTASATSLSAEAPAHAPAAAAIDSNPAVIDALAELQRAEAEAAAAVGRRAAQPGAGAGTESGRGKYGAVRSGLSASLALEPKVLSAWEQLQLDEAEAERKFKELVCTSK